MINSQSILEAGEFLGRYKTADGRQIGFYQNAMDNLGFDPVAGSSHFQDKPSTNSFFDNTSIYNKFNHSRYYGWQQKIIKTLQNNKDVYVVAPPGGGKTTPLMAHFIVNLFLCNNKKFGASIPLMRPEDLLKDMTAISPRTSQLWGEAFSNLLVFENAPKVLFITPIRTLAMEQAEGFQEIFIDLIIFAKSIFNRFVSPGINYNQYISTAIDPRFHLSIEFQKIARKMGQKNFMDFIGLNRFEGWLRNHTERMVSMNTGGEKRGDVQTAVATIATYGTAKNFIKQIAEKVNFIVYDEAHLYQPSDITGDRSQKNEINAAQDVYDIIRGITSNNRTKIAFLSGTINEVSANNLASYINKRFNRNIEVNATKIGDPEAVNKTKLQIVADDSLRDQQRLTKTIVEWITRNKTGSAVILFSKKTINQLVEEVKKKLSPGSIQNLNDNLSRKSILNSNEPIEKYISKIKDRQMRYEMEDHFNAIQRKARDAGEVLNLKKARRELAEYENRLSPEKHNDIIRRIKNKPGAEQISNQQLKEAVAYGIGYIFTMDKDSLTHEEKALGLSGITEKDKLIVADLFSKGKIPVLIATPSIGVGVNVAIKNMYIPSLYKFEGSGQDFKGSMTINNKREMSQLINRAGRGLTPISAIHTPKEFVPYMNEIIGMQPNDFPEVPAIMTSQSDRGDNIEKFIEKMHDAAVLSIKKNKTRLSEGIQRGGTLISTKTRAVIIKIKQALRIP